MQKRKVGLSGFKSHGHRSHVAGWHRFIKGKHWVGDALAANAKEIMRRLRRTVQEGEGKA